MIKRKTSHLRQQIISEYLSGEQSYLALEGRYGIKARTIQSWVRSFRKLHPTTTDQPTVPTTPGQLKGLQKELQHLSLKNELLEELLRLAEQHTGIDITKKYGTRQS